MFPVLDFIPGHEISRLRRQPFPVVAWPALDADSTPFPFSLVLASLLLVLLVQLLRPYAPQLSFAPAPWFKALLRDPFGIRQRAVRLVQLDLRYRASVEKFVKMAHRYRSLQVKLKVGAHMNIPMTSHANAVRNTGTR